MAEIYKSRKIFTRRNGLIFSLFWFLIFVLVLTPLFGIANAPDELIAFTAIIGTMGALIMTIASFLILKSAPKNKDLFNQELPTSQPQNFFQKPPQFNQPALPPQQEQNYVPPVNVWKAPDTGNFARPGSVTENTTKLLEKDDLK